MSNRITITAALLALALPVGIATATAAVPQGPQPIYSAFTLIRLGSGATKRCGLYDVRTATYTGTAVSPDARMAGPATYTSSVATLRGRPTGIATGTLTIRDTKGRVRHRTSIRGVLTQETVVNGLVSGRLYGPNAFILANVTILFDDEALRATFRLGLESGANTGIAYPAVPTC